MEGGQDSGNATVLPWARSDPDRHLFGTEDILKRSRSQPKPQDLEAGPESPTRFCRVYWQFPLPGSRPIHKQITPSFLAGKGLFLLGWCRRGQDIVKPADSLPLYSSVG